MNQQTANITAVSTPGNKRQSGAIITLILIITMLILPQAAGKAFALGIADAQQTATGLNHTAAVKSDGTVWAYGKNNHGQIGNGTTTDVQTPVQVPGLSAITAVATGGYHTVALKSDGTVWVWGYNGYGQLGDGTTTDTPTPIKVPTLSNITAIAAGLHHTLALANDGTVYAWGYNAYGQLGTGTNRNSHIPVKLPLSAIKDIKAGLYHTTALASDGTVWTCGQNGYGQLGDGTNDDKAAPVQITSPNAITTIATGFTHTVALKSDGTAWSWGDNYYGQLADGTSTGSSTPMQTQEAGIAEIRADSFHTILLKSDGTTLTYGYDYENLLQPSFTVDERNGTIGQYTVTTDNRPRYAKFQAPQLPLGTMINAAVKDSGQFYITIYGKDGEGSDTGFIDAQAAYSFTLNATGTVSIDYGRESEYYRTNIMTVAAPHTITATILDGEGNITPSGATAVATGESLTYVITPAADYHTALLRVNNATITSTPTSYTFPNVNEDHTIEVIFLPSVYEITVQQAANGSITPYTYKNFAPGSNQTYNITPNAGYHVETLTINGESQPPATSYNFTNIHENNTITATFAPNDTYLITAKATAGGSINPQDLQVLGGQSAMYQITPDAGYRIDSVFVDSVNKGTIGSYTFVNINTNHSIAAAFAKDEYTITTAIIKGMGTITPAGPTTVQGGTSQTYSFTPAQGYRLRYAALNGAAVALALDGTYTLANIRMNGTIGAYFEPVTYTITVEQSPNGSITPYTYDGFKPGVSQTYSIKPKAGYYVETLTVDGAPQATANSYTFSNINANHTISATYAANPAYVINAKAGTGGTITPSGDLTLLGGQGASFAITPDAGNRIDNVLIDGINKGALTSYLFTNVAANHTIEASFVKDEYTITATVLKGMGSISPAGATTVTGGASQTYSFAPAPGYKMYMVTVNGAAVKLAADGTYTFPKVNGNYTIGVTFVPVTYTITVQQTPNGSISPYTYNGFKPGATQTYKIAPYAGYHVEALNVDGLPQTPAGTYTFTDIQADHTITATFAPNPSATITATAGANGSITPTGTETILSGTNKTYSFAPANGYRTAQVYVDGTSRGTLDSYTFVNITPGNHTINVTFNPTVTATAGTGGSMSPIGTSTVTSGGKITYYIYASAGYRISDILVDGTSVGAASSYTFSNVTTPHTISATFQPN